MTVTMPLWALLIGVAVVLVFGIGASQLITGLILGSRSLRPVDLTPEPVPPPAPVPEPEPAPMLAIEATPVVAEVVEPERIVVIERAPEPVVLPPAPVAVGEAPIFERMPARLPKYDSMPLRFDFWTRPVVDPHMTGSFPEIRLELEDDAVVPPTPMEGWEPGARKTLALRAAEQLEVAAALPPKRRARKAKADLDNNSVVVS